MNRFIQNSSVIEHEAHDLPNSGVEMTVAEGAYTVRLLKRSRKS
jgi:hypothetical protein